MEDAFIRGLHVVAAFGNPGLHGETLSFAIFLNGA